jgi:ADP-ribosyl-[dinitrogen reductase] hydrolase
MNPPTPSNHALGCLLGAAVGDALGLPTEGLSCRRATRFCRGGLRHRLVFGRGMFSDDAEHTLMVATTLVRHGDDAVVFQRSLGWSLRWWLLALPAGVGLSTAKAIVRLWLGFPAARAGVRSAGNGAAMRSAIIGVVFREDAAKRHEFTLAACRLTHTDARAEESALLVAEAAALASRKVKTKEVIEALRPLVQSEEMIARFVKLELALSGGSSVSEYAAEIGCERGVSGFAPNTVAAALFAWLRHRGQFDQVLSEVIACGGDTDTAAAIAGGICGAEVGEAGIPKSWIDGIFDWPRSVGYIRRVASALGDGNTDKTAIGMGLPCLAIPVRNLLFLLVILLHGFRRLLPPY